MSLSLPGCQRFRSPRGPTGWRPGVQECKEIALLDHLFVAVGRGVELRREQVYTTRPQSGFDVGPPRPATRPPCPRARSDGAPPPASRSRLRTTAPARGPFEGGHGLVAQAGCPAGFRPELRFAPFDAPRVRFHAGRIRARAAPTVGPARRRTRRARAGRCGSRHRRRTVPSRSREQYPGNSCRVVAYRR